MIIDLILDRKDGERYDASNFYFGVLQYDCTESDDITRAMDAGTNEDVQNELCKYVIENEYNPQICDYIRTQIWV